MGQRMPQHCKSSRLVKLGPRMTRSWEKGPQELHIFSFNRDHVWNSQMGIQECLNVTSDREPTCISQMGIKTLFCIFKPIIPLLPNSLHSRPVKLGPRMTRRWENGAQELHVFARNEDHMYNSQIGIQILFHLWKWRILLFKNHLHLGLTRINPQMIRIWSKWAKECLNVARAREPTYISPMGIKKLFYIFKRIIPLFLNSLHLGLVKLGPRKTRSWEKRGPRTTHLRSQSRPRVQLSNGYPNMIYYLQMKNVAVQNPPSFGVNQNPP